jgi:hypothetical protein
MKNNLITPQIKEKVKDIPEVRFINKLGIGLVFGHRDIFSSKGGDIKISFLVLS